MSMHNPAHPGEILKELVITPLELIITAASEHLNVSSKTLSKVVNGRGAITPEMALRLEPVFKNHSLIIGKPLGIGWLGRLECPAFGPDFWYLGWSDEN